MILDYTPDYTFVKYVHLRLLQRIHINALLLRIKIVNIPECQKCKHTSQQLA